MTSTTAMTPSERTEALTIGRDALDARPSNLGLSPSSVAYRTHAPTVMQHRDSGPLERSNFAVVSADLLERFGERVSVHEPHCPANPHSTYGYVGRELDCRHCPPDVVIERFRDFAYGWTEHLLVRVERPGIPNGPRPVELPHEPTDAWLAALEWRDRLEGYPVADEEHYSSLEYDELADYVAGELDGPDGEWTALALDGIGDSPDGYTLDGLELEPILSHAWHEQVADLLEQVHAWHRLRLVGTGQLTLDGDTVVVPVPPTPGELVVLHPDELPRAVARAVEGSDTVGELEDALDMLQGARAVA